jgi:predicted DNA-binding transcriptional regulator YafY
MRPATDQHLVLRRVERHHALLEHMATRTPRLTTARALAEGFGVAVRTVERDLARLRAAGVPIAVHRGPGGGYRLDCRRELPPISLTAAEVAALVASLVALGPSTSASALSATTKLLAALTPPAAQ